MLLSVGMVSRARPCWNHTWVSPWRYLLGWGATGHDGVGRVMCELMSMGKRQAYQPAAAAGFGEMPGVNSPTPAPARRC
jgi:hypothetical protein